MKCFGILAAATLASGLATAAAAQDVVVGVSWSNFQEERWKTDEAAIKAALDAAGAKYISADAQSSSSKQLADVESLIASGANALIILAQDAAAITPAVDAAANEGIPVVAYDRLIEDPRTFYLTFDNVEVGRMQARAVFEQAPEGNYVMIKGSLHRRQRRLPARRPAGGAAGGDRRRARSRSSARPTPTAGCPANAQKNMEQILTQNNNKVDAVVASNDGTAGGVVAALTAQGLEGIPVSGQDGDKAALNRIALGTQTVSVWKDSRELGKAAGEIAVALAGGAPLDGVEGSAKFASPGGNEMNSILLTPIADHQGQPRRRGGRRLDHQGRALRRRRGGIRRRLQLNLGCQGRPRAGPPRSVRGDRMQALARLLRSLEIDLRLLGHAGRAGRHLAGLPRLHRRPLPDPPQPLQPVGADLVGGGDGDRHGLRHRHPQHRPVGRLAARLPRHDHGRDAGPHPAGDRSASGTGASGSSRSSSASSSAR